jgi:hypothetical protein
MSSLLFFLIKTTCLFATPMEEKLLEGIENLLGQKENLVSHSLEQGKQNMIILVCHNQGEEKQKMTG